MSVTATQVTRAAWRVRLHEIIFEADTPAGKTFDVSLIFVILVSVLAVMLDSVTYIGNAYGTWLFRLEWVVTALFTLEYLLRLVCVAKPARYARSFFGLVDLIAILPTYLSLILPGSQTLLLIRTLRLIRIFRIFKLVSYVGEASILATALRSSFPKIVIFIFSVLLVVLNMGALMYLVEGEAHGFTSIPRSIYWAIVTMTTVGYGDIAPQTVMGQTLAAALMIMGYGIIAVPTGIVSAELIQAARRPVTTRGCPVCVSEGHERNARYCKDCGANLEA